MLNRSVTIKLLSRGVTVGRPMDVALDATERDRALEKEAVWRGLSVDLCILYGLQCLFSKGPIRLEFARECFDRRRGLGVMTRPKLLS